MGGLLPICITEPSRIFPPPGLSSRLAPGGLLLRRPEYSRPCQRARQPELPACSRSSPTLLPSLGFLFKPRSFLYSVQPLPSSLWPLSNSTLRALLPEDSLQWSFRTAPRLFSRRKLSFPLSIFDLPYQYLTSPINF